MMIIRHAESKDLNTVNTLLHEVLEIHAKLRPDLFISGTKKYTDEELLKIFASESTPVFVAEEDGTVYGYIFCEINEYKNRNNMPDQKILYIDDLCVDENARGKHVGQFLYEYVIDYARSIGCTNVTLNVWEGNDAARKFYEKMGMKPQKTVMETVL